MVTLQRDLEGIDAGQLNGFFVGWPARPTPETLRRVLAGSSHVTLAVADKRVVGFITAHSDGVLSAYIPLLEVLPEYQRQGIGRRLVEDMLHQLNGVYMVDLTCDPALVGFYERVGMTRGTAVMRRNYEQQRGAAK
jgi:ribosomal protein S18 acetylase RimI-like enzyme